jgi:hypothetical protein
MSVVGVAFVCVFYTALGIAAINDLRRVLRERS